MTGLAISELQGLKEADNCTETTCSLILASLRGTAAHHLNGDAIRVAETARMHLSAGLILDPERSFLVATHFS